MGHTQGKAGSPHCADPWVGQLTYSAPEYLTQEGPTEPNPSFPARETLVLGQRGGMSHIKISGGGGAGAYDFMAAAQASLLDRDAADKARVHTYGLMNGFFALPGNLGFWGVPQELHC